MKNRNQRVSNPTALTFATTVLRIGQKTPYISFGFTSK